MNNDLIEALNDYMQVKKLHDKAKRKCVEDWSYFGSREIDKLEKAKKKFFDELNSYIDDKIDRRLGQGDYRPIQHS